MDREQGVGRVEALRVFAYERSPELGVALDAGDADELDRAMIDVVRTPGWAVIHGSAVLALARNLGGETTAPARDEMRRSAHVYVWAPFVSHGG